MLDDLEFAKEQYRQHHKLAKFIARTMPDGPEKDRIIERCVDTMAECLARVRELEKKKQ